METTELKAYKNKIAKEIAKFIENKCDEFEIKTSLTMGVDAKTIDSYYETDKGNNHLTQRKYKVNINIS